MKDLGVPIRGLRQRYGSDGVEFRFVWFEGRVQGRSKQRTQLNSGSGIV